MHTTLSVHVHIKNTQIYTHKMHYKLLLYMYTSKTHIKNTQIYTHKMHTNS